LVFGALFHDEMVDINYETGFESGEQLTINGRLRTKLVDCQRMYNPWQWYLSAQELGELDPYDEDEGDGRALGPLNEMMTKFVFPKDDDSRFDWKPHISDISVAEWGWSAYKPYMSDDPDTTNNREDVWETPKLYNFWYRPIYIFESESVRHEEKAICE
jgi:hypothetical protein